MTVAPLRDADGEVANYVGFQVDVTERKEAQLALAAERERLDRLVDRINGLLADVTELLMHGVDRAFDRTALRERLAAVPYALDDFVSFVLLWGAINAFYAQWLPVVVAAGLGVGLLGTRHLDVGEIRAAVTRRVP